MKLKNFYLPLLCAVLLACEGERLDTGAASRSINVNAAIEAMRTRASGSEWDAGDAIGIFMKKAGETLSAGALTQNAHYVLSGTTAFQPENEAEEIVFPFNASDVDFIAYYPFRENLTDFVYVVNVADQSNQAAIDLLYSDNAVSLNSKSPYVNMTFSHQLTKIVLNIRPETASTDLSGLSVRMTNAGTSATFSLIDGTLSEPSATGDIVFKTNAEGLFAEAIVLPSVNLTDKYLVFQIGEDRYLYPLADAQNIRSFEKSTRYTYNVTLNPSGVAAVTEGAVTDWMEGPTEDITLNPTDEEIPNTNKGTKENPYTVEEARANQGKNEVWVEGFIVGSFDRTVNNYFPGATGTSKTNIALAGNEDETDVDNMLAVNLDRTSIQNVLNLVDNPTNVKKRVLIKGNLINYLNTSGLRNLTEYEFVEP